jgi:hypothetical protein
MLSISDTRAIENLIAVYTELVDSGDFAGLGEMFADGVLWHGAGEFRGRDAVERGVREHAIIYEDGTPRTNHITTNIVLEADEQEGTAAARSYVTVLQALPDLPLQVVATGRYRDKFVRREGRWRFAERRIDIHLEGDLSRHLR